MPELAKLLELRIQFGTSHSFDGFDDDTWDITRDIGSQ
jgi:hypothetical protein